MTKRSADVNSVFDLSRSKLTVLVIKGSRGEKTYEGMKADRILKGKSLVVGDYKAALAALESDKADAFIMDEVSLYSMRAATKTPDNYVITRHAMSIDSMAFMFRKGDPAFKKLVDSEVAHHYWRNQRGLKWFESHQSRPTKSISSFNALYDARLVQNANRLGSRVIRNNR